MVFAAAAVCSSKAARQESKKWNLCQKLAYHGIAVSCLNCPT